MSTYEFAILGPGAIGSICAAHLARAGHSVVVIARGRRAQQIKREGLKISGLANFAIEVPVLLDATELESAQVMIVAMKTPGTAEAVERLDRAAITTVFSVQNGPEKNDVLVNAFGRQRVLGALADTSGELAAGGEVQFTRNVNIFLGELDGGLSPRARRIAQTLDASGVHASASEHILNLEWSKFCGWAGLMAVSVTTRAPTGQFLSDPGTASVVVSLVRELGRLANTLGFELTDRSVLPVASICAAEEARAVALAVEVGLEFQASVPHHRMSSLQDLDAGRPLEIEATLGYSLRKASELGLSLPVLNAFYHLASGIDRIQNRAAARRLRPAT